MLYRSWGYPFETHNQVLVASWRTAGINFSPAGSYLPYGCGRSYGDVCLNESQVLIDTQYLNHFIDLDESSGILRVESGLTLDRILDVIVPQGWFIPVSPGTRYVTVGGMVANDVHGKNHHNAGTFGCHIISFELYRSSGERIVCSTTENVSLFNATIGGLGLTGLIVWVEIKLKKIANQYISKQSIRINNLQHYFNLEDNQQSEYSVAWIDTLAQGNNIGRGIYFTGHHASLESVSNMPANHRLGDKKSISVPFNLPSKTLNKYSVKLFNYLYIRQSVSTNSLSHYKNFFYPLDNIKNWNRIYGKMGLYQHQCVVPETDALLVLTELLNVVAKENNASFLSVLKKFGSIESPGLLSFPRPGYTLAMDFSRSGPKTLNLLKNLNDIVCSVGGAIYPAKDAVMSEQVFMKSFTKFSQFKEFIDPKFSSSFWRRVMNI